MFASDAMLQLSRLTKVVQQAPIALQLLLVAKFGEAVDIAHMSIGIVRISILHCCTGEWWRSHEQVMQ